MCHGARTRLAQTNSKARGSADWDASKLRASCGPPLRARCPLGKATQKLTFHAEIGCRNDISGRRFIRITCNHCHDRAEELGYFNEARLIEIAFQWRRCCFVLAGALRRIWLAGTAIASPALILWIPRGAPQAFNMKSEKGR
jgi:hypothetical protein